MHYRIHDHMYRHIYASTNTLWQEKKIKFQKHFERSNNRFPTNVEQQFVPGQWGPEEDWSEGGDIDVYM